MRRELAVTITHFPSSPISPPFPLFSPSLLPLPLRAMATAAAARALALLALLAGTPALPAAPLASRSERPLTGGRPDQIFSRPASPINRPAQCAHCCPFAPRCGSAQCPAASSACRSPLCRKKADVSRHCSRVMRREMSDAHFVRVIGFSSLLLLLPARVSSFLLRCASASAYRARSAPAVGGQPRAPAAGREH